MKAITIFLSIFQDFSNVLSSYQLWQKKMPPADADGSPKRAKLTEKQLKWKKSLKMLYSTLRVDK